MNSNASFVYYVGIDLAWSPDNPSGVAVINNELTLMPAFWRSGDRCIADTKTKTAEKGLISTSILFCYN